MRCINDVNKTCEKINTAGTSKKIACIIMASGLGRRFGGNKLLAELHGQPLLQYVLNAVKGSGCLTACVTVTRHAEIATLCAAQKLPCLLHSQPRQSDTVRLGLEYLEQHYDAGFFDGFLFCAADQPLLSASTISRLCAAFNSRPRCIHRAACYDKPGNPVLFPVSLAAELKSLTDDSGGSAVIKKHPGLVRLVQVQDAKELQDIDYYEDLLNLEQQL